MKNTDVFSGTTPTSNEDQPSNSSDNARVQHFPGSQRQSITDTIRFQRWDDTITDQIRSRS
ncbi:MAG: hypothetical protein ABEK50_06900 [bacterium]